MTDLLAFDMPPPPPPPEQQEAVVVVPGLAVPQVLEDTVTVTQVRGIPGPTACCWRRPHLPACLPVCRVGVRRSRGAEGTGSSVESCRWR